VRLSFDVRPDGELSVRLRHEGQQQHGQHEQQQQQTGASPPPASQQEQQQQPQGQGQQQAQAQIAQHAEQQFGEVADALLGLLSSDLLPPLSLATLGWLLNQLLSVGKGGAQLTPAQRSMLDAAAARRRAALRQQLQGRWPDALPSLVAWEWGRCRQAVLRSGPGPVHVAVQTWMQVGQPGRCACLAGWL
jgi:hypothetical protein